MKVLSIFIASLLLTFGASADVGFDIGNKLILTPAEGTAHVRCQENNGGYYWSTYYCDGTFVNPSTHGAIINTNGKIDADKVEVVAIHADGSDKSKTEKFNSKKQKSGDFNLVISTLLQSPLLEAGNNVINYNFTKKGQSVKQGSFGFHVARNPKLYCEALSFSQYGNCNIGNVCDRYYRMRPRCD